MAGNGPRRQAAASESIMNLSYQNLVQPQLLPPDAQNLSCVLVAAMDGNLFGAGGSRNGSSTDLRTILTTSGSLPKTCTSIWYARPFHSKTCRFAGGCWLCP